MTPGEFAAIAAGVLSVIGILAVLVRVAVKIDRVERLAGELTTNGGSSLKDAVIRIEKHVTTNTGRLDEVEKRAARNEGRIEAIALIASPTMLIEDDEGVIRESRRQGS